MGVSVGEIARCIGRRRSTIERDLVRNPVRRRLQADSAERRAWARKLRGSKIERFNRLRAHVEDRLELSRKIL
jgi:IS30 family transposase